jgi:hypothetical protein
MSEALALLQTIAGLIRISLSIWLILRVCHVWSYEQTVTPKWLRGTLMLIVLTI